MVKKAAFIFRESDLSKLNIADYEIFPMNHTVKRYILKKNIDYRNFEDYFDHTKAVKVNKFAYKWANSWYSGKNKILNNLNLSLHNYFSKKLFLFECIEGVLNKGIREAYVGREENSVAGLFYSNFESITPIIELICHKRNINLYGYKETGKLSKILMHVLYFPKLKRFNLVFKDMESVIFASSHYHIVSCIELLKSVKKIAKYQPIVVGKVGFAKKLLKKEGISFIDYNGELRIRDLLPYIYWKIYFLLDIGSALNKKYIYKYDDYDLYTLFRPKIISLFLRDVLILKLNDSIFNNILKKTKTKALITVTNGSVNQTFINVSRRLKVPNMEIQHGITFGEDGKYFKADKYLVWGSKPKNLFEHVGVAEKSIEITGWPAFEVLKKVKKKNMTKREINIAFLAHDPEGFSSPFLTQSVQNSFEIFFEAILSLRNIAICIRLHPRADRIIPEIIARKYNVSFKFSEHNEETLADFLQRADIVVGQTTSAILDAIIMHKPVIYFPSMNWPGKFVESSRAVFVANTSKEILDRINYILKNGLNRGIVNAQSEFINNYCNFSENSIENIIKLIKEPIYAKKG